jgi:hypothetical protein
MYLHLLIFYIECGVELRCKLTNKKPRRRTENRVTTYRRKLEKVSRWDFILKEILDRVDDMNTTWVLGLVKVLPT